MNHSNADKWAKKSYKEIHVPAPKQRFVVNGELVPVTALPPPCAHEVFNVPKLNHVLLLMNQLYSVLLPVWQIWKGMYLSLYITNIY